MRWTVRVCIGAFVIAVLLVPGGLLWLVPLAALLPITFVVVRLAARSRGLTRLLSGVLPAVAALVWLAGALILASDTRVYYARPGGGIYHESPLEWLWVKAILLAGTAVSFGLGRAVCRRAARSGAASRVRSEDVGGATA